MEERAQVNLEYILIIAGAVIIAAAVGLFVKSTAQASAQAGQDATQ